MNLQLLIDQYIAYRRSLGEQQDSNGSHLRRFGRFIGPGVAVADVQPDQVNAFLAGKCPVTLNWHIKLSVLRSFYQYAVSRGYVANAPLPSIVPKRPPAFIPYIYARTEVRRLLQIAKCDDRYRPVIRPRTMHMAILLLYATGLRVQELIDLDRSDVNLADSTLIVHQSKFGKTRLIPFSSALRQAIHEYMAEHPTAAGENAVLVSRYGHRIKTDSLHGNYRTLCEFAGIRRSDGARYQPRIHDLRHTFAVHRLIAWYQQGADVHKMLPLLSVYMGHVHIRATQVYLTMVPELLEEANKRFEQYATRENVPWLMSTY